MRPLVRGTRAYAVVLALLPLALLAPAAAAAAEPSAAPPGQVSATTGAATSDTGAARPLMVVLDVSGSMAERDSSDPGGVVKVEGAQAALVDLVRQLPTGSTFGLWTYPSAGSGGGCSTGRAEVALGPLDRTSASAKVNALRAEGDTPTAEALQAAVAEMQREGYRGGTVLLVSDGESTCAAPCPVAEEITRSGFDLTVEAMGFRIDAAGESEMACMAEATGGHYTDVDDSEALNRELAAAAGAALALEVSAPSRVPPGSQAVVRATVSNPSAVTADDVVATFTFLDDARSRVRPLVPVPRRRLGNLPPGQSLEVSWPFVSGAPTGRDEATSWRVVVTARGGAPAAASGVTTFTRTPLSLADAGPVLRPLATAGRIAILGDSFSAGEGAGTYRAESDRRRNRCHRSDSTYAMALFPSDRTPHLLACSGAVVADLYAPDEGEEGEPAQLDELDRLAALASPPEAVLLTIGGNDIGFADIIAACVKTAASCADWRVPAGDSVARALCTRSRTAGPTCVPYPDVVYQQVAAVQPFLRQAYEDVARALNTASARSRRGGRVGQVVVLAYPDPFPSQQRRCAGFEGSEQRFGKQIVQRLNGVVADAVREAAAAGYPVHFADTVAQAVQPDHTVCDGGEPWMNPFSAARGVLGLTWSVTEKELMHPNARGYSAMTTALVRWSQPVEPLPLTAPPRRIPLKPVRRTTVELVLQPSTGSAVPLADVTGGGRVRLTADGYAPHSPVVVRLRSLPRALATAVADRDGRVAAVGVRVPGDTLPGQHRLSVEGFDPAGEPYAAEHRLDVRRPPRWWAAPLGLTSAASLAITGLVLLPRARRRRAVRSVASAADGTP